MPDSNLHISKALSNISLKYQNSDYIAQQITGTVPVRKEADLYWVHQRDLRIMEARRGNGAVANEVTWSASTSSYSLPERALSDIVTDRDRENADEPFSLDADATEFLTDKLYLDLEKQAADLLFTSGSWSGSADITATGWTLNTSTALPILNANSAAAYIELNAMKTPNKCVMGNDVFRGMAQNADILDRIKYTEKGLITKDIMASAFDVEQLLVGKAVYDSAREGQTESLAHLWTNNVLFGYFNPSPRIKDISAAHRFAKTSGGNPFRAKKWRVEDRGGDMIEVSAFQETKLVATTAAYLYRMGT